jgi:VanZ family protein
LPKVLGRSTFRDGLFNVLLYMPFGGVAFLALDRVRSAWLRMLLPLILGLVLSTGIEFLQLMDFTRTSSVLDVAANVIGTAIGVAAARAYTVPLLDIAARTQNRLAPAPTPPLVLLYLWIGYQVFPLFPSIGYFTTPAKLRAFFTLEHFSVSEAALTAVEWLVIAAILKALIPGEASFRWLLACLLFLPARLFLLGRTTTASEVIGAVTACVVWYYWLAGAPRSALILACLMVAALIHLELSPYRFSATSQPFSWIPLSGLIETGPDWGAVVFLKKSFWYGATVWALREVSAGYLAPALVTALMLGALEWIQRYVPGRTPEITDPLLALVAALFLHLFQQNSRTISRHAEQPLLYPSDLL